MSDFSTKKQFEALVVRWLNEEVGVPATGARLEEYGGATTWAGCETCGPETEYDWDIYWTGENCKGTHNVSISPLTWLRDLLNWEAEQDKAINITADIPADAAMSGFVVSFYRNPDWKIQPKLGRRVLVNGKWSGTIIDYATRVNTWFAKLD